MPDCSIQLEWTPLAGRGINQHNLTLQKEIYARYADKPDSWLFFLGFCSKSSPLSVSLAFWRRFIHKLTSDLEALRSNAVVALADDERAQLLESAPLMLGGLCWGARRPAFLPRPREDPGDAGLTAKDHTGDDISSPLRKSHPNQVCF
ncbi:MAG: hypothetical protein A2512_01320 [Deltaproteobacteria bacterium RIFOXYD12_FULL_56_24]|nr:MAG: hypothetical protein A2512_01320 [Deltaproteobacteria bacterium RIFOXYD12_FULL_56_24]